MLDAEARVFLKDNLAFFEGLESDHDHARLIAAVDGQDRFAARLRIVEMMALAGLLAGSSRTRTWSRTATARTR